MSVLRWILVVPLSFACGVLATMMDRVISRYLNRLVLVKMITGFCAGVLCISVAGWLAPSHQKATMVILAIVYGLYWISQARKVAIVSTQRVDWLFVSCALGGLIAALGRLDHCSISFIYRIRD